jgi:hypothetical protein
MRQARFTTSREPNAAHPASLYFSGQGEGPGLEAGEDESDWDELEVVELIEREGFIRTESLAGDWE